MRSTGGRRLLLQMSFFGSDKPSPLSLRDIPPFGGNLGRAHGGIGLSAPRTGGGCEARGEGAYCSKLAFLDRISLPPCHFVTSPRSGGTWAKRTGGIGLRAPRTGGGCEARGEGAYCSKLAFLARISLPPCHFVTSPRSGGTWAERTAALVLVPPARGADAKHGGKTLIAPNELFWLG
jgi:hypothetical protein